MTIVMCVCSAASVAAGEWHTYHGDFALTGVSADSFSQKPERLWRVKVGGDLSSPVVGGGAGLFFITLETFVMSLDLDGKTNWRRTFQYTTATGETRTERFYAPPLYVHEELLVVASAEGNVYALSPTDGEQLWRYTAGDDIQGTPNYREGEKGSSGQVLVMTQNDGVLHAVDAASGQRLWVSEPTERTDGHVAVSDGRAVFGNCAAKIFVVDVGTGNIAAAVSVGEGCEMADGVAVRGRHAYAGNRSGAVACVDLKQETLAWVNTNGVGGTYSTPAVSDTRLIFCGESGTVHGMDPKSGEAVWASDTGGSEPVSPVIAGDDVIAPVDGTLYGFSLSDGALRWKLAIGDEVTPPAIIRNMIVVGTDDGYVAAYGIGN